MIKTEDLNKQAQVALEQMRKAEQAAGSTPPPKPVADGENPMLGLTADERIDSLITLVNAKKQLESALSPIKERIDQLEEVIAQDFLLNNQQSVTRSGMTVYLSRDVGVSSASGFTGDVVDAMRKARLSELIGLNWPKLKAWIKERMYDPASDTWEVNDKKLPPSIREVVTIKEINSVRCRKA